MQPFWRLSSAAVVVAIGCSASHAEPPDAGLLPEAGPPAQPASSVDLLIVKQNNARGAYSAYASAGVAGLLDLLMPPDGPPCAALRDIHIGVVTSDLSASEAVLQEGWYCRAPFDDGTLERDVEFFDLDPAHCNGSYPAFEQFPAESREEIRHVVECKASNQDESGCSAPQLLEASLKAVATPGTGISFMDGTAGHGEDVNAGFLRPGSFLAIVYISSSDDCSIGVTEPAPDCTPAVSDPTRYWPCCDANLVPVERYVDAFTRLRPDGLQRFAMVASGGLRPELLPGSPLAPIDYDRILGDPSFADSGAFFSCGRFGVVSPPRRFVQLARALGDHAFLSGLMCVTSYSEEFARMGEFLVDRICRVSVP